MTPKPDVQVPYRVIQSIDGETMLVDPDGRVIASTKDTSLEHLHRAAKKLNSCDQMSKLLHRVVESRGQIGPQLFDEIKHFLENQ